MTRMKVLTWALGSLAFILTALPGPGVAKVEILAK